MNASVITLAANVNDILSRYILIHDQIIKFSIRKLIPIPGLFKAIPFCTHENDLDALLGELAAARGPTRARASTRRPKAREPFWREPCVGTNRNQRRPAANGATHTRSSVGRGKFDWGIATRTRHLEPDHCFSMNGSQRERRDRPLAKVNGVAARFI